MENVKHILNNEDRNLSLHYPGADLAYAYTASALYRQPKSWTGYEKEEQSWECNHVLDPKLKVSGKKICAHAPVPYSLACRA